MTNFAIELNCKMLEIDMLAWK